MMVNTKAATTGNVSNKPHTYKEDARYMPLRMLLNSEGMRDFFLEEVKGWVDDLESLRLISEGLMMNR